METPSNDKESRWLRNWADELNSSVNKLAPKTLLILSVSSFLAIAALLIFLLIKTPSVDHRLAPQAVQTPIYIMDSMGVSLQEVRRQAILRHLNALLRELDSLQANPVSRPTYDSLLRVHPHLRDSLLRAQQLFLQPLTVTP